MTKLSSKTSTNSTKLSKNKAVKVGKKKGKKGKALKIEAKPLSEEQIQHFLSYYKEHKSFPGSKIPCTVTGKLTTCVGPWMVKKIKEFGGAENLLRKYVCRGALKAERQSLKPGSKARKQRKEKLNSIKTEDKKDWNIPKMGTDGPKPISHKEVADVTKDTCLRPDVFLDNDRYCDGCQYFEWCTNVNKALIPQKKRK